MSSKTSLTRGIAGQPLHHVSISGKGVAVDCLAVQANLLSLDNEKEGLLSVSQIRCAEDERRSEQSYVCDAFMATEATVPIGPKHVRKGHVHSAERFPHYLRRLLVRQNALDAAAACGEPSGLGQHLRREVPNFRCPLHTPLFQKCKT